MNSLVRDWTLIMGGGGGAKWGRVNNFCGMEKEGGQIILCEQKEEH